MLLNSLRDCVKGSDAGGSHTRPMSLATGPGSARPCSSPRRRTTTTIFRHLDRSSFGRPSSFIIRSKSGNALQ